MRSSALTVALVLLVSAGCAPTPSVTPAPSTTTSPSAGPTPTAAVVAASPPPIEVACSPDLDAPAALADPCPAATVAVELAVASVRLPIARIVIEPGPFFCDNVWPGSGSDVPCYGPMVRPGQFMHAWATFASSDRVAAVMLGRDLPTETSSPAASPPPWSATLVTVAVPPVGWSMP